jgi:hypothetical protein
LVSVAEGHKGTAYWVHVAVFNSFQFPSHVIASELKQTAVEGKGLVFCGLQAADSKALLRRRVSRVVGRDFASLTYILQINDRKVSVKDHEGSFFAIYGRSSGFGNGDFVQHTRN